MNWYAGSWYIGDSCNDRVQRVPNRAQFDAHIGRGQSFVLMELMRTPERREQVSKVIDAADNECAYLVSSLFSSVGLPPIGGDGHLEADNCTDKGDDASDASKGMLLLFLSLMSVRT